MSGERTEKPTARRRKEARREGQVPRTHELGGWASVLVFALFAQGFVGRELDSLRELMIGAFRAADHAELDTALDLLGRGLGHVLIVLVALGTGVMLVAVVAAVGQGGFFLATKTVQPKLAKLSPKNGAKRMFGTQAMWQATTMAAKSAVVVLLVYGAVRAVLPTLSGLVPGSAVLATTSARVTGLLRDVALAGLLLAVADYAYQRRRVGNQIRMTKQEIKQEHKQSEGDPQVRAAIRSHQLALARSRMFADVPRADVVLVNPTHVAIALVYDPKAGAPTVVARGAGAIATKIREEATRARVPLVQDVPLARALYTSCRVGQQIPPELFAAVAQVLAYVISRRRVGAAAGEHRSPRDDRPLPEVPRRRPRTRRPRPRDLSPV